MRGGRGLRLLVTACMHSRVAPLLMPATAPKWRGALRQSYQANGGLLYKTNFLAPAAYEAPAPATCEAPAPALSGEAT